MVLAHEPDGPAGQVERRLVERGVDVDTHLVTNDYERPLDAAPFPSLAGVDLLVPMGSVRSLTRTGEIHTWIHQELAMVAEAHDNGLPVLGICFGGQVLAEALGGSVEPAPRPEIGWHEFVDGTDGPCPVPLGPWFEWHHDRFIPPPAAEVLARTEDAIQLFRVGQSVGTQFHPEVDLAHVRGWLTQAPDAYLAELGVTRGEILASVEAVETHSIHNCRRFVDWFLDEVSGLALRPPGPRS
jgi:GMP synthase-like glutamine amidotransferase